MHIDTYFTYNRHKENRGLSKAFADLMVQHGFALLVPGETDYSSVLRLELMMRDSDCFVAIESGFVGDGAPPYASAVLFENGIASRANKPRLLLLEAGLPAVTELRDNSFIFDRNAPLADNVYLLRGIEELKQSISSFTLPRSPFLRRVGFVMDSTKNTHHIYSEVVLSAITELLLQHRYEIHFFNLTFTHDPKLYDFIDECDFLVVEGRSSFLSPQIAEAIFSRFIPTVRLCHIRGNESVETVRARELSSHVAGHELQLNGKRIQPVIFWEDIEQLEANLNEQLAIIASDRTSLVTHEDVEAFFDKPEQMSELKVIEIPGTPPKIFLSNSSTTPDPLIKEITNKLESERIEYFHYEKEEGIPLGEVWKNTLTGEVQQCDIFVALINRGYADSEWCMYEMALALDRLEQGQVRIFPYYLEGELTAIDAELDPRLGSIQHKVLDFFSYHEIANSIIENYKAVCEIYY